VSLSAGGVCGVPAPTQAATSFPRYHTMQAPPYNASRFSDLVSPVLPVLARPYREEEVGAPE
jgi:hypothetical protein